jgi:hypothetical protein
LRRHRGAQAIVRGGARCASPLPAAPLVVRRRYFIVVPRSMPAAALVVRRGYLIVEPRPMPAAQLVVPCRYLIVVLRPLPPGPLVVHRSAVFFDRNAQAVSRGGARCASKVLERFARRRAGSRA